MGDNFKEYQFYIPRKLEYLASWYPDFSWNEFKLLYASIVYKYLIIHNYECLLDAPHGQGLIEVRDEFIRCLEDKRNNITS